MYCYCFWALVNFTVILIKTRAFNHLRRPLDSPCNALHFNSFSLCGGHKQPLYCIPDKHAVYDSGRGQYFLWGITHGFCLDMCSVWESSCPAGQALTDWVIMVRKRTIFGLVTLIQLPFPEQMFSTLYLFLPNVSFLSYFSINQHIHKENLKKLVLRQ